ncbi:E-selectin-like [Asterias amurensis]|uniref:E-selectin-like n=1 Tax=Asterias amurensis TaxID=7602 RepID=UPI003AB49CB3
MLGTAMVVFVALCLASAFVEGNVECPDPGMPVGGMRQGPSVFSTGSKVYFECPDGFERVGSPVSVCQSSGEWSLPVPKCIADCDSLEAPANGDVSTKQGKYGSVAHFQCNHGYSLVGARAVTCMDGQWNHETPSCFADCEVGESPSNSQTNGSRGHGNIQYFKCLQGYQLIGPSMVTCKNGAWSEAYPSCLQDIMV